MVNSASIWKLYGKRCQATQAKMYNTLETQMYLLKSSTGFFTSMGEKEAQTSADLAAAYNWIFPDLRLLSLTLRCLSKSNFVYAIEQSTRIRQSPHQSYQTVPSTYSNLYYWHCEQFLWMLLLSKRMEKGWNCSKHQRRGSWTAKQQLTYFSSYSSLQSSRESCSEPIHHLLGKTCKTDIPSKWQQKVYSSETLGIFVLDYIFRAMDDGKIHCSCYGSNRFK